MLRLAVAVIGRCHAANLWQADIHLDNFMRADGKVYFLDGGDVNEARGSLAENTALDNLALFFAQFPVTMDQQATEFFQHYQSAYGESAPQWESTFPARIRDARLGRIANYERKLFRSTSAHRCTKDNACFLVHDRELEEAEVDNLVSDPDAFIDRGEVIKAGNTSTVARIDLNGRNYILKRYNIKSFGHGLKRMLQPSRAHHCWRNARVLQMLGIRTPHPWLFFEERRLWFLRRRAFLLCDYVPGQDLLTELESGELEGVEPAPLMDLFRKLFTVMREYLISHGDFKLSNFIVHDNELYVMDLDAMRRYRSRGRFLKLYAEDLQRFARNFQGTTLQVAADELVAEMSGATQS